MNENDILDFLNTNDYDLRKSHNARWIDQKCTPDVLWSISDFILNYVINIKDTFSVKDIWKSDYAKSTIAETFSKPGTDEKNAENEYDKVFAQPMSLLCYAKVLEDTSTSSFHLYKVKNLDVLNYIAKNDNYSLRFLQMYIEKVLKDSDLIDLFYSFLSSQSKESLDLVKKEFINFYHLYTPVKKQYEPKRIFTKVLNPLAYKHGKLGTKAGMLSNNKIIKSDLMYNRDNFRDVYIGKPKGMTRKEWLEKNPDIDLRTGYFEQMLNKSKQILKDNIINDRNYMSELTQFDSTQTDMEKATQIHHIFPKNEYPEVMHYLENLIALTPNQHFCYAHPNNNTQIIDVNSQKSILIAKVYSIEYNTNYEEQIYDFDCLKLLVAIAFSDENFFNINNNDFKSMIKLINNHYEM